MRRSLIVLAAAVTLVACGQSGGTGATNETAAKPVEPKKPAYCFFKDTETKGWVAKRGQDGNIAVTGKVYRSDPRYKAVLGAPVITATTAELSPTIAVNDTGYAAAENWWEVTAAIPDSAAIDTVKVSCGAKTLADIKVAPKG
jgi:hypothetical protein